MSQLSFGRDTGEQLERAYIAYDILRRRAIVYEALRPLPGQRILDAGCGPGFYVAELAEKVGPDGLVVGVDRSSEMLGLAAARSAGRSNVEFREGEATALPVQDEEFDAAVSVQMLEYLTDVDAALAELHSASCAPVAASPCGTSTGRPLSWHSDDPERMQRVLDAWDDHLADPVLPRTLGARLSAAGFERRRRRRICLRLHQPLDGGIRGRRSCPRSFESYLRASLGDIDRGRGGRLGSPSSVTLDEQRRVLRSPSVQFCFSASKPGSP